MKVRKERVPSVKSSLNFSCPEKLARSARKSTGHSSHAARVVTSHRHMRQSCEVLIFAESTARALSSESRLGAVFSSRLGLSAHADFNSEHLEDIAAQNYPSELRPGQSGAVSEAEPQREPSALIPRPEWKAKHELFNEKASLHLLVKYWQLARRCMLQPRDNLLQSALQGAEFTLPKYLS